MKLTNAQNSLLVIKPNIPFFSDLENDEVLMVTRDVKFTKSPKGEMIFDQGEYGTEVYYVVTGAVEVQISKEENGKTSWVTVARLPKKSVFGEMAFITGEPRTARMVSADDDTSILSFGINEVGTDETIYALSSIFFHFAQDLAQKLKVTSAKYAQAKTAENVPYDELVTLFQKKHDELLEKAANKNILTVPIEILDQAKEILKDQQDANLVREIIKTAITEGFALGEKDMVIFSKDRLVVRFFQELSIPKPVIDDDAYEAPGEESPAEEEEAAPLSEEEQEAMEYLNALFRLSASFEQEVLQCKTPEDLQYLVRQIANDAVNDNDSRKFLNFRYLTSYSNFRLMEAVKDTAKILWELFRNFFVDEMEGEESFFLRLTKDPEKKKFISTLAERYVKKYRTLYTELIADSFIEAAAQAPKVTDCPPALQEAIMGNATYKPLFLLSDGRRMISKVDQLWIRASQAAGKREASLKEFKEEVEKREKAVEGIEKNIEALHTALHFTFDKIKDLDADKLRDIVVNDEGEFTEEKRLLQFLPSGDLTLTLRDRVEKGLRGARNDVAKEEYKRALKYFENLHVNNTQKVLEQKLQEMYQEKPSRREKLEQAREKLEEAQQASLANFDEALLKMKQAIMRNIGMRS